MEQNLDENDYPSVELAYDFVKPSYELMESRFEAANNRLQNMLGWALTITVAIPLFAKSIFENINFLSPWFFTAALSFVFLMITGIIGYTMGRIVLVDPAKLFKDYMDAPRFEFKRDMIYYAGENFDKNDRIITRKSVCLVMIMIFLTLEISFASIWVLTSI